MRARNSLRMISIKSVDRSVLIIVILAAFFLGGSFAGFRFFEFCNADPRSDIEGYLIDFCEIANSSFPKVSIFRTIVWFFFCPAVVFLGGLSPLGMVLIPGLSFCLGFGVLFTVQCFLHVFSRAGIFPVLTLLFVRLVVTLMCFLLLAVEILPQAWRITQVTIRSRKSCESIYHGRRFIVLALFCLIVLIAGVCCERFLTPVLFRIALEEIL